MRQSLVVVAVFLIIVGGTSSRAQQAADSVIFLVPRLTPLTTGVEGDVVIFSGRPAGTIDPAGCAADGIPRYLHSGVLVDAGSGDQPTRLVGSLIGLYTCDGTAPNLQNCVPLDTPVRSGTRVGNLNAPTQCTITIGGTIYDQYAGTVQ